jgi:hypothetical protein
MITCSPIEGNNIKNGRRGALGEWCVDDRCLVLMGARIIFSRLRPIKLPPHVGQQQPRQGAVIERDWQY